MNNKYAVILLVLFLAGVAIVVDTHMPLASFRIPLSETIDIKILVFDKSTGFAKTMVDNAKLLLTIFKEFLVK